MSFFTKAIVGSAVVLLVAVAAVLLFRSREAGRVEALIREAAEWARNGEEKKLFELVDEAFEGGPDYAESEIRRRIRAGDFRTLEIVELKAGVSGEDATANVVVRMETRELPLMPYRLRVALKKRSAGWRVLAVEWERPFK